MAEFHGGLLDRYQLLLTSLRDTRMHLADVRVLAALLRRHNERDAGSWPRVTVLEADTGLSRRQVIRSLQLLEEYEFIEIDRHDGRSSFYRPKWDAIVELPLGDF